MTPSATTWKPNIKEQRVINRAAEMIRVGLTPYSDLAVIIADLELKAYINLEHTSKLGTLAWRQANTAA